MRTNSVAGVHRPAATSAIDVIEQHLEHFAVEFRTWILLAAGDVTATDTP
jgi:hypothetical protein